LLFLLEEWQAFIADPWAFIFTGAGFTWYGGLIGGGAAGAWCVQRPRLPRLGVMDVVAPAISPRPGLRPLGCPPPRGRRLGPADHFALGWGLYASNCRLGFPPWGTRSSRCPLRDDCLCTDLCGFVESPLHAASHWVLILGVFTPGGHRPLPARICSRQ